MAQDRCISFLARHYRVYIVTKTVSEGYLGCLIPDRIPEVDTVDIKDSDGVKSNILTVVISSFFFVFFRGLSNEVVAFAFDLVAISGNYVCCNRFFRRIC